MSSLDPLDYLISVDRPPLEVHWNSGGGVRTFRSFDQWRSFIECFDLAPGIPTLTILPKYRRAQRLYLLGWLDYAAIEAGQLAAVVALEYALQDRYGADIFAQKQRRAVLWKQANPDKTTKEVSSKASLSELLSYLVRDAKITDADIPMSQRSGVSLLARIDPEGGAKPSLLNIRNSMAHGDPFGSGAAPDLLELCRDLIEFAYRDNVESRIAGPEPRAPLSG